MLSRITRSYIFFLDEVSSLLSFLTLSVVVSRLALADSHSHYAFVDLSQTRIRVLEIRPSVVRCLTRLTIVLGLGSSRANHACHSQDF